MNSGSTAKRARSKAFLASMLVLAAIFISACGRSAVRIAREEALPLQVVFDAQLACDATAYISAFPPDYIAAARADLELTEGVSLEEYITGSFLEIASQNAEANYGSDFGAEFIVSAILDYPPEDNARYFEKYADYYVYDYDLDVNAVHKSVRAVGTLNKWGSDDESTETAYFVFLMIDGKWYLHPMYFLITF